MTPDASLPPADVQRLPDGLWSWCRIMAVGPPCKRLCGECRVTNESAQRLNGPRR